MFRGKGLIIALLAALAAPANGAAAERQATLADLGKRLNIDLDKL